MPEEKKEESFFKETLRFAIITLAIVLPIRFFVAEPFIVSGASMEPTFEDADYLIVDRLSYHFEKPQRNDIVIFRYPKDPSKYFIKRIIGLPEESIFISGETITIKNKEHPSCITLDQSYLAIPKQNNFETTLNTNEYFVMGDNRAHSSDSRIWGPLPEKNIIGRALLRLFPFHRINVLPGKVNYENN